MLQLIGDWPLVPRAFVLFAAALAGGYVARWIIQGLVRWSAPRSKALLIDALARRAAVPFGWTLSVALVFPVLPLALPSEWVERGWQWTWVAQVLVLAWLGARLLMVVEDVVVARLGVDLPDNLRARKVQTQLKVIRQFAVAFVLFLAVVVVLMSFERMRDLGTGLLASAGVAGIVLGLAAQRTLSNVIAGFLIAFTQPIRLDDVVIVENEWGRVEEITLSYVVVRIWDLRRLIVPISYFLDHPFQNWTRTEARILGSVLLHLDYCVPIEELRAETERLVKAHRDWDGQVCSVQVVEATASALEVRLLVSAADSGSAWNLRCDLREQVLAWLARRHPQALPRTRASVDARIDSPKFAARSD